MPPLVRHLSVKATTLLLACLLLLGSLPVSAKPSRKASPANSETKVFLCPPIADRLEHAPLVGILSPACDDQWVNPSTVSVVRPTSPAVGAPRNSKTEILFHDGRAIFGYDAPEAVAAAIPGLVQFHRLSDGGPLWINPRLSTAAGSPVLIQAAKGAKGEIFMSSLPRSIFVRESPQDVAAKISRALRHN